MYWKDLKRVVELISKVYEHSPDGGNLHVQLDDGNLDNEFFTQCRVHAKVSPEQRRAELECFNAMKQLTRKEREAARELYHDGFTHAV